jgi:hypothetical protein
MVGLECHDDQHVRLQFLYLARRVLVALVNRDRTYIYNMNTMSLKVELGILFSFSMASGRINLFIGVIQ